MLLELTDLTVSYGKKVVLDNLNLQIKGGAIGLLGPNGAGKSTLIKTLLGFLVPTNGHVNLFGKGVRSSKTEVRQLIGYMPENDSYIPGVNAVSFVGYAGELCGMDRKAARQRAHEVLNYVGIDEIRYRPVETYTTGVRQRLKLAQALVHDPDLLLLDEPTNGMDQRGREAMLSLVTDLSLEQNTNIIFSSHILKDIESTCTSIIALNDGKIAFSGEIKTMRDSQQQAYEIELKGDVERFLVQLDLLGFKCEKVSELRFLATPNQQFLDSVQELDSISRQFFQLAFETNAQIRHLRIVKPSLEDIFHQQLSVSHLS